jgi:hypothetical protein
MLTIHPVPGQNESASAAQEQIVAAALAAEKIQHWPEGKTGRLVNIAVS